jgi:iron complex transport system substrate-binding protein
VTRTRTTVFVAFVAVAALLAGAAAPAGASTSATADGVDAQDDQLDCSYPQTFTDAVGNEVQIDEEPQRIVTLNPSAAQTLWEIGGKDKVVGVSTHAMYLEGADEKTDVSADPQSISTETVVDLEPDLVLAPNTIPEETTEELRSNGLTVYRFASASSISDVYDKTERIGELSGECEGAADTVEWMQTEIAAVEEAVDDDERPRVYFEFFGVTPGAGTFQDEVLTTAGGQNVAAEAGVEGWGEISDELLVEQEPQALVLLEGSDVPQREAVQSSSAVQNDRIVRVDTNQMQQPAPRVVYAIQDIHEQLDQYEYETESSAENESEDGSDEGEDGSEDGGDSIPGFGVATAVGALLAAGFLFRRR